MADRGRRRWMVPLWGCLAAVGIAFVCPQVLQAGDSTAAGAGPPAGRTSLSLLLRLSDLPRGYRIFGGTPEFSTGLWCDRVAPANPQPELARFLERRSPAGCMATYSREYRVPGGAPAPALVGTAAMRLQSVEAAEEGLEVAPELISHQIGDVLPDEVPSSTTVGDRTRLFHWNHPMLLTSSEASGSFLVWRSGTAVAAIFVSGGAPAANDRVAAELADVQQQHLAAPSPYTPADFDDTEVGLDNPALGLPVYWLGRRFDPGKGLPPMTLISSSSSTRPPGPQAGFSYAEHRANPNGEYLLFDLWSAKQWRRLRAEGLLFPRSLRCPTAHKAGRVRKGALVLQGFEPYDRRCRDRRHRAWALRVNLGRAVVTVETVQVCATCAKAGSEPYDTFRGMATVARGLVRRARP